MEQKSEAVKLTRRQAWELISRYACGGLNVRGGESAPGVICYMASTGCLEIFCENDWRTHNGRIRLTVTDPLGGNEMTMYFRPDTLERDTQIEEAEKQLDMMEKRREWVLSNNPDHCHQMVDRYWNGERDDDVGRAYGGTE